MPYPKDTIGLQNPNLVVASVSYCTQCENTGRYILGITVSILISRKRKKITLENTFYIGFLGQISIECINACKPRKKLFKNGLSSINNPYKQTFNIELETDAVSIYVWVEAIGRSNQFYVNCYFAIHLEIYFSIILATLSFKYSHIKQLYRNTW